MKHLIVFAFLAGMAILSACGGPDDSVEGAPDESATTIDAVRSDGALCHGICYSPSAGIVRLCYPNITERCHEQIVDACHRRGLSFVDAYWSHWGCG